MISKSYDLGLFDQKVLILRREYLELLRVRNEVSAAEKAFTAALQPDQASLSVVIRSARRGLKRTGVPLH